MKPRLSLVVVTLSFALGGFVESAPSAAPSSPPPVLVEAEALPGWIGRPEDNVCGISDLRKISNPARVDYPTLFEATPPIREMRRERIDPQSARGRQLRRSATELITKACEAVRRSRGFCGVWRDVRHSDGRTVPNVTNDVQARF